MTHHINAVLFVIGISFITLTGSIIQQSDIVKNSILESDTEEEKIPESGSETDPIIDSGPEGQIPNIICDSEDSECRGLVSDINVDRTLNTVRDFLQLHT